MDDDECRDGIIYERGIFKFRGDLIDPTSGTSRTVYTGILGFFSPVRILRRDRYVVVVGDLFELAVRKFIIGLADTNINISNTRDKKKKKKTIF